MRVYNKTVKQSIILELIKKIKQKKELANVNDSLIEEKIQQLLKQDKKLLAFFSDADFFTAIKKSKNIDRLIKPIRKELRLMYGVYQLDNKKLKSLVAKLKTDKSFAVHKKILALHLSSKERLGIYPKFYKDIFKITGIPDSIIDIASGLNPFSYPYLKTNPKYTAIELNKRDAGIINRYFKIMKIKGKALAFDITKKPIKQKADIAFAFKIFDLIPNKAVERIIRQLKVKYIIATFPTKTISKKRMTYIKRGGFQRMLKRLKLSYKKLEYSSELVYVIKKD
ncbi:hypothetical protein KY332_02465 [Candidatus Woesearchaeota archaeon]|nr:hypothetical protein [Candidatus Woesearchaeota archaeon]